jgi:hypothetical protein
MLMAQHAERPVQLMLCKKHHAASVLALPHPPRYPQQLHLALICGIRLSNYASHEACLVSGLWPSPNFQAACQQRHVALHTPQRAVAERNCTHTRASPVAVSDQPPARAHTGHRHYNLKPTRNAGCAHIQCAIVPRHLHNLSPLWPPAHS